MNPRPFVPPEINVPRKGAPLLVGRDPGYHESQQGRPFVGDSGTLLFGGYDKLTGTQSGGAVGHAGLMRSDFNITNRVLRQPPGNDFFRHTWEDIKDGRRQLFKLIEELQPSVIVATGNEAAYDLVPGWATLTDKNPGENTGGADIKSAKGVTDRRGFFWYPDETGLPCPLLVTLHPASCLYQAMPNRLLFDIDFARLGAHMQGDLVRRTWPTPTRVFTSGDLAPLWDADLVSYDVEITWGGDRLLCIAFFTNDGQAFLAYDDAIGACSEWLRSDRPKLAHNGQFDRYFLETRCGIKPGGRHEDTICAHWACYPELAGKEDTGREDQRKSGSNTMTRKGLNFLASFHLDVPWWKVYTSDRARMGQLCVNDVAATMWAWHEIEPEVDDMHVRGQYERRLAMLPALITAQRRGFLIDEEMRQARIAAITDRQARLEEEARDAALTFLRTHALTHRDDGSEYWWYHDARCECCFGGALKSAHCDACAGIVGSGANGSIKKDDLLMWAWRSTDYEYEDLKGMKKDELLALLPACAACEGRGTLPTWDFNVMSPAQLPEVLWEFLEVPRYVGSKGGDEDTLKKALEWAEEQSPNAQ